MMEPARWAASATVCVLLSLTLLSGPLVGAVDFTPTAPSTPDAPIGSGSADVFVESVPSDGISLARGKYGSTSFYLTVPDAHVRVAAVTGQPMVIYKIRIPELGYTYGTTRFLRPADVGTQSLTLQREALAPERVTQDSYDAELVILVRAGGDEHELRRQSVTVEVTR